MSDQRTRTERRVVVTGGAGFIGSHVADVFLDDGYEVIVIDDLSTGIAANVPAAADLVVLDVAHDPQALMETITKYGARVICHLAAQSSVTVSVSDPAADAVSNVIGTMHVLEAALLADARVVFASSGGALYGNARAFPIGEETPCAPVAPYGASKLAAEAYVGAWGRRYGLPNVILRPGNVYGPRQRSDREAGVVAIFSQHLREGRRPTVYGYGTQTGDYVHAVDVARAFLLAAESDRAGVYNVASGVETTPLEILDLLQQEAGTDLDPILVPLREGELERNCLDPTLILRDLGWVPEIGLADGVADAYRSLAPA